MSHSSARAGRSAKNNAPPPTNGSTCRISSLPGGSSGTSCESRRDLPPAHFTIGAAAGARTAGCATAGRDESGNVRCGHVADITRRSLTSEKNGRAAPPGARQIRCAGMFPSMYDRELLAHGRRPRRPMSAGAIAEIEDRLQDLIEALREIGAHDIAVMLERHARDFTIPERVRNAVNAISSQLERWREDPLELPQSPKVTHAANGSRTLAGKRCAGRDRGGRAVDRVACAPQADGRAADVAVRRRGHARGDRGGRVRHRRERRQSRAQAGSVQTAAR